MKRDKDYSYTRKKFYVQLTTNVLYTYLVGIPAAWFLEIPDWIFAAGGGVIGLFTILHIIVALLQWKVDSIKAEQRKLYEEFLNEANQNEKPHK